MGATAFRRLDAEIRWPSIKSSRVHFMGGPVLLISGNGLLPRRRAATGQMLEEYVLLLGLIVVPALAALPALAAALRDWLAQTLAWWSLPAP